MKFLEYLQSKPRGVRAQYAALIAGIVTGAVAVVWATTLPSRFASIGTVETDGGEDELSELVGDAKEQLGNAIGGMEGPVGNIGKNLNLLNNPTPEDAPGIGGLFVPKDDEGESVDAETPTTTREKRILIETTRIVPKTILIGTTTGAE